MDLQTKSFIRNRALSLFEPIRDALNAEEMEESLGHAFKFVYLVIYNPKKFLVNFNPSLRISTEQVDQAYRRFSHLIPGKAGLTAEEVQIITRHNLEVQAYERMSFVPSLYRGDNFRMI